MPDLLRIRTAVCCRYRMLLFLRSKSGGVVAY